MSRLNLNANKSNQIIRIYLREVKPNVNKQTLIPGSVLSKLQDSWTGIPELKTKKNLVLQIMGWIAEWIEQGLVDLFRVQIQLKLLK